MCTFHLLGHLPRTPALTWGQGLLQLLGLLFVRDDQGVKVSAASDFKLHVVLVLLDLDSYQMDQNQSLNCTTERHHKIDLTVYMSRRWHL